MPSAASCRPPAPLTGAPAEGCCMKRCEAYAAFIATPYVAEEERSALRYLLLLLHSLAAVGQRPNTCPLPAWHCATASGHVHGLGSLVMPASPCLGLRLTCVFLFLSCCRLSFFSFFFFATTHPDPPLYGFQVSHVVAGPSALVSWGWRRYPAIPQTERTPTCSTLPKHTLHKQ